MSSMQMRFQTAIFWVLLKLNRYQFTQEEVDAVVSAAKDYGMWVAVHAHGIVTGFFRLEGKPFGLLASDCQQLGGAVDANSAEKSAEFLTLCDEHSIPMIALVDTPGFMVGPQGSSAFIAS